MAVQHISTTLATARHKCYNTTVYNKRFSFISSFQAKTNYLFNNKPFPPYVGCSHHTLCLHACALVVLVFLFCISYVTNLASWLQDFNKITYLLTYLLTPIERTSLTILYENLYSHRKCSN